MFEEICAMTAVQNRNSDVGVKLGVCLLLLLVLCGDNNNINILHAHAFAKSCMR